MLLFILYWLLTPIFWIFIPIFSIFNQKIRHHLLNSNSSIKSTHQKIKKIPHNKTIIQLHAASIGEFEQLQPIIKKIDKSKYFILISFSSSTVFKIEKETPLADAVCYHPFDFPWSAWLFFKKMKIKFYIITRNDIWPSHLFIAKNMGIKTILINANLYKKTHYNYWLYKYFFKSLLNQFNSVITTSERLKKNLSKIISEDKIIISGDSRLDRALNRKTKNIKPLMPDNFRNSNTLILGSIVQSDIQIVFGGLKKYYNNGMKSLEEKNHRIIIVPHEINLSILRNIEKKLKKLKLEYTFYSEKQNIKNSRVIIIDTVGILADLYSYSKIAYIGAGFSAGVHSVIEPAVYNNAISFGPNFHIVDMAVSLLNNNLASVIETSEDFTDFCALMEEEKKLQALRKEIKKFISSQPLASEKIINAIFN